MTKPASTARTPKADRSAGSARVPAVDELFDRRFVEHWVPRRLPPDWKPEGCTVRKYVRTEVGRFGIVVEYEVEERR